MKRIGTTSSLAVAGLVLVGCSAPTPQATTTAPAPAPQATTAAPAETTAAPTAATTAAEPTSASPTSDASASDSDRNQAGLAALATAAKDAGGTAVAIDRDDDGWDVDVLSGDTLHEVRVNADGSSVTSKETDTADADDKAAAAAKVGLADAIEAALQRTPGGLDDADWDDNGRWEITIDTAGDDDVEVRVDPASGEVVS